MANNNNFDIPKGGYVAFDALSLRQLIIDRLNEQKTFTDQTLIGSNLASIIDIVAYSYHTLIYYLNKTSTESLFSEAQLYENMNRIVKLIDYNPVGFQTSTLSFTCSASNFAPGGTYTIPRYSFVLVNNIPFSFNEDITFIKQENGTELLSEISRQKLLYQGQYQEYPVYTAIGSDHELVILNAPNEQIDHFNIDVYVKTALTNTWKQYTKTANLYFENGDAEKYEIRLNGNFRYEIKFGNNINGRKLQAGDQVAIYYLRSSGIDGEVGPQALSISSSQLLRYNTTQYNSILVNILGNDFRLVTDSESAQNFDFDNATNSTPIKLPETPDEIRQTAPANYRTQYRLVTLNDYKTFIESNFANLVAEVNVINNWDYVSEYLKYFYDIGIQDPLKTDRALLNQVLYADSCNFNNIYFIIVPRSGSQNFDYLSPAQKELINNSIQFNKVTTTETVFIDPVYKAVDLGIAQSSAAFDPTDDTNSFQLKVIKQTSSRRDNDSIVNEIVNVFSNYFSRTKARLGQIIDIRELNQQILNIRGVDSFFTVDTNSNLETEGLSLAIWNPIYPNNDKTVTTNNIKLNVFEYPFFNNLDVLAQKIKIQVVSTVFETIEY